MATTTIPHTVCANERTYNLVEVDNDPHVHRATHYVMRDGEQVGLLRITRDRAGLDVWVRADCASTWSMGYWHVPVAVEALDRHVRECGRCWLGG